MFCQCSPIRFEAKETTKANLMVARRKVRSKERWVNDNRAVESGGYMATVGRRGTCTALVSDGNWGASQAECTAVLMFQKLWLANDRGYS